MSIGQGSHIEGKIHFYETVCLICNNGYNERFSPYCPTCQHKANKKTAERRKKLLEIGLKDIEKTFKSINDAKEKRNGK